MIRKLIYLTTAIIITACQSDSTNYDTPTNNPWEENTYEEPAPQLTEEELHRQLEQTECEAPNSYLDGSVSYKPIFKNVLSSKVKGLKLTFEISSSATLATYQDLDITVELQSKTGSVIKREDLTIYEYIQPYGSTRYKYEMSITNQQYKDLDDVSWYINGADCL